jgi:hypothetical protein
VIQWLTVDARSLARQESAKGDPVIGLSMRVSCVGQADASDSGWRWLL